MKTAISSWAWWNRKTSRSKYSGSEEDFRRLWKNYYRHMGIEERRNPRERRNFLPKKYWGLLTEMEDPYNRSDLPLKGEEKR